MGVTSPSADASQKPCEAGAADEASFPEPGLSVPKLLAPDLPVPRLTVPGLRVPALSVPRLFASELPVPGDAPGADPPAPKLELLELLAAPPAVVAGAGVPVAGTVVADVAVAGTVVAGVGVAGAVVAGVGVAVVAGAGVAVAGTVVAGVGVAGVSVMEPLGTATIATTGEPCVGTGGACCTALPYWKMPPPG